jgi:PAS domain-containing protein
MSRFEDSAAGPAGARDLPRDLPEGIPPEMFTGAGMLALADLLPVMVAYLDRDLTYRFVNRAYADWFERPRTHIIGKTAHEHLGDEALAEREPILVAALAGERQWFASSYEHPTRGRWRCTSIMCRGRARTGKRKGCLSFSTT